jgi:hypothetical protein
VNTSPTLLLGSTEQHVYVKLIKEGEVRAHTTLSQTLEQYLVHALIVSSATNRHGTIELLAGTLAMQYERALQATSIVAQATAYDRLGTHSLLLVSFFPRLAERRHVSSSYFRDMGKLAYGLLSDIDPHRAQHAPELQALVPLSVEVTQHFETLEHVLVCTQATNPHARCMH